MKSTIKIPLAVKVPLLLIGFYVFVMMLYLAQDIILPLIYATFISILIGPAVEFMVKKKINRALSISAVLFVTVLIVFGLIALIISRASMLGEALPQLSDKFSEIMDQFANWLSQYFDIRRRNINAWLTNSKADLLNNSNATIKVTLATVGRFLSVLFLTPVYVFMILLYKDHLVEFIHRQFGNENKTEITEVITSINAIVRNFLIGLSFEFMIVAALNTIGLYLLGIKYAVILGIVGALLNIIPYLGGVIAGIIYMLVALVTKTPEYVIYVVILYGVIQFMDNNFIVPKIVGSKVKLNALLSIIAVITGGALWGIPGMFLAIPLTAIIKLTMDHIDALKPWGFLLSDTVSKPLINIRIKSKNK